jgi:hypothetical protein
MRPLDNRKLVLRCYEGFKKFVFPNIGMSFLYIMGAKVDSKTGH